MAGWNAVRVAPRVLWVCALIAVVAWAAQPGYVVGWDLNVYKAAVVSLRAGHNPYEDAMAIQRVFHAEGYHPPGTATPFSYVYSPITLPLLQIFARHPSVINNVLYWTLYAVAVLAAILVGIWASRDGRERRVFLILAPLALFFPGLLEQDVLFSGNIAYILYGAVLVAAWWGWTRGKWWAFYAAVLLASCFKAPLLYLLTIPVLSARRQWLAAGVTGALGVVLFAVQPHVWPALFHSYLTAVELQFSYNHDFSSSPAGLLADIFYDKVPYKITTLVSYAIYGATIFTLLWSMRKKFLAGRISLQQWVPLMLVGVALLNLRIMEYDVAPLPIMMALVMWRVFSRGNRLLATVVQMCLLFALLQVCRAIAWRPSECFTLIGVFVAGYINLWLEARDAERGVMALESAPVAVLEA